MKLLAAQVENFGSYKELIFEFSDLGLVLIHGATGSGKSTLQDIVPWILYGVTAKAGNADEIRSWTAAAPTFGVLHIDLRGEALTIKRVRGTPSQNDLHWLEGDHLDPIRGKDITETQKLLEQRLGISADLYIAGAYYNEFSPAGSFFLAKAKDRRELLEKITDLSLPIKIAERTTNAKRDTKKALTETVARHNKAGGRLEAALRSERQTARDAERWDEDQTAVIKEFQEKSERFEEEKAIKINILVEKRDKFLQSTHRSPTCPTCGGAYGEDTIRPTLNPYDSQIEATQSFQNTYAEQIERERKKPNSFLMSLVRVRSELAQALKVEAHEHDLMADLQHRYNSLEQLQDLSAKLRGALLVRSIAQIEGLTNSLLSKYFDAELRVAFTTDGGDNLEVQISKNGYDCVYKQLSKGQRGLLKLCFAVSIMKAAANEAGMHFDTLFFDESLDGLDSDLKTKAFSLFSELSISHSNVLVIDHSGELQTLFSNKFQVTLNDDISEVKNDA